MAVPRDRLDETGEDPRREDRPREAEVVTLAGCRRIGIHGARLTTPCYEGPGGGPRDARGASAS